MTKNLELIEKFFVSEDKTLIINQINDEIGSFYNFVIDEFSKKNNKLIVSKTISDKNIDNNDLFGISNIYIYNLTNSKNIKEIANNPSQKIILTDYKNYKRFKDDYISINGYNFEKDIRSILINYFNIDNEYLISYCSDQPYLIYSETSKYKINDSKYLKDSYINNDGNLILNIRKDIFDVKKAQINIRKLFSLLKNEVHHKKFNFLTY